MPRTPRTRDEEKEHRRGQRVSAKAQLEAAVNAYRSAQQAMWSAETARSEAQAAYDLAVAREQIVIDGGDVEE